MHEYDRIATEHDARQPFIEDEQLSNTTALRIEN
jgi:hypothetical protein